MRGWTIISSNLALVEVKVKATLYVKVNDAGDSLIVSIYVDDMLVIGSKIELVQRFKDEMEKIFEMIDLGVIKYFLGMELL